VAWKLTVRTGPRVEHDRFGELEAALDALEARARELARDAGRDSIDLRVRRFEPTQQVTARIELAGPQRLLPTVHAGIDLRGDGSSEAYTGRVRRRVVERRGGETAYGALRRALTAR
jgi:hypothetical protein